MTQFTAGFEGYADGALLSTTSVGGDNAWNEFRDSTRGSGGGGTITATATTALKGTRSMVITPDGTTASLLTNVWWYPSGTTVNSFRFYFQIAASPSTTCHFVRITNSGAGSLECVVAMSAGRNLLIYDATNTLKATASVACAVNTLYRMEGTLQNGTGGSDTFNLYLYTANSTTPVWSSGPITSNFGTLGINRFSIGKHSTCTWGPIYVDDVLFDDATATPPGPTTGGVGAPTVTVPTDFTRAISAGSVVLTATATAASGGTITGYAWTLQSGPSSTVTGQSTNALTVSPPAAAGTQVWRCTVTQTG